MIFQGVSESSYSGACQVSRQIKGLGARGSDGVGGEQGMEDIGQGVKRGEVGRVDCGGGDSARRGRTLGCSEGSGHHSRPGGCYFCIARPLPMRTDRLDYSCASIAEEGGVVQRLSSPFDPLSASPDL
ncbi:hypothetical protein M758_4G175000 [Ceratodon purpureus]|nr:hypothetical protein M758_4G175000 [Ceratodon purpureus]